jgi:predicted HNH restriction endonuclease
MINKHYRESALKTYGETCEICGHKTALEVHHIDYQEQWDAEKKIRKGEITLDEVKQLGYLAFFNNQLAKNDSTKNLAVLCGNCHSLIHTLDSGKKLLKAIKERK